MASLTIIEYLDLFEEFGAIEKLGINIQDYE